ncbi:MAG: hypothetical protein EYC69_00615 [Bacteroidetes bacterium]|nr:MAG: hypothetical protein EYC69_00615 [Bacteroidota bacterium]
MKQKFFLAILSLFISIKVFSQSKPLDLAPFSSISIAAHGHIFLSQGAQQSVVFTSGENVDNAMIVVKNGVLLVNAKSGNEIEITMPSLEKISIGGKGVVDGRTPFNTEDLKLDISGDGKINLEINSKKVDVNISGLGKVVLRGTASESNFNISGSGKVEAIDLKTSKCNANISGLGKCSIDVTDQLISNISGSGAVTYKTKPANFEENISGVGKTTIHSEIPTGDTTRLSFGSKEILIIDEPDALKLQRRTEPRPIWAGFEFGFNSYLSKDGNFDLPAGFSGLELRQEKSISVSLNLLQKNFEIAKSNLWFFTGLGINWNNYRFDNNISILSANPISTFADTNSTIKYEKSKLVASYLTAPIMFEYFTGRDKKRAFHIGAGAMLGLRIGSHTKQKYEQDGKTYKPKTHDDFNLNPFRYGFRVALGYGGFNLFADYYASTLFKENKGPSLYPVAIGITLADF